MFPSIRDVSANAEHDFDLAQQEKIFNDIYP
jgi:hypothetical protein